MKPLTESAFVIFYKYLCPIPAYFDFDIRKKQVIVRKLSPKILYCLGSLHIFIACQICYMLWIFLELPNHQNHSLPNLLLSKSMCMFIILLCLEADLVLMTFYPKGKQFVNFLKSSEDSKNKWSSSGN